MIECRCYPPRLEWGPGIPVTYARWLEAEQRKACPQHGVCIIEGCSRERVDKSFCGPHREYIDALKDPFYREHDVPVMAADGSFARRLM